MTNSESMHDDSYPGSMEEEQDAQIPTTFMINGMEVQRKKLSLTGTYLDEVARKSNQQGTKIYTHEQYSNNLWNFLFFTFMFYM